MIAPIDAEQLGLAIQTQAKFAGLDVAFSPLTPLDSERDRLAVTLEYQPNSSRNYSLEDLSDLINPQRRFPWAQGIACFALPYPLAVAHPWPMPTGEIAPFCAHDWYGSLKANLRKIRANLKEQFPSLKTKIMVEGRILEKSWAERSGLGWIGKNSLLFHPRWGSRILLGELLLQIAVPIHRNPLISRCGDCRKCLENCPTFALAEPYQVKGGFCLDYFTLCHEGSLPEWMRIALGGRLFGCSACQDCCPWNDRGIEPLASSIPLPSGPGAVVNLSLALTMDTALFQSLFQGHTFRGLTLERLQRNALAAAGNRGDASLFALLDCYCNHMDPLLREQAEWSRERLLSKIPRN